MSSMNANNNNHIPAQKAGIVKNDTGEKAADEAKSSSEQPALDAQKAENYFPAANIMRLVKKIVPANAKVSKEAIADIQEKVCDFISFISSEAGVHCISSNRRTVKGEDIISALNDLGFDNYGEVLSIYLAKFKESVDETRPTKKLKTEPLRTESSKAVPMPAASSMSAGQGASGSATVTSSSTGLPPTPRI
jgi:nuclear transcription Y subunit beta